MNSVSYMMINVAIVQQHIQKPAKPQWCSINMTATNPVLFFNGSITEARIELLHRSVS